MQVGARYLGNGHCTFTVWSPDVEAMAVQIVSTAQTIPMARSQGDYWQVTAQDILPDTLYFYQLNNQESRPDPASQSQPQGVHGPSQVIDQAFEWTDHDWAGVALEDLIIYEIHVGTFTPEGTFDAIIPRIQTLKELGVTAIELMPISQFPGDRSTDDPSAYRNWGYDGTYLYAVQNSYGGVTGLKRLVDACHQQGMAVMLDVVYNHFGPEGNYISQFGSYFTDSYRTPWGSAVNYDNVHSHHVRNFFIQNTLYWLREYHLDALRLDAVHAIYDLGAKHILAELAEHVEALSNEQNRKLYLIAESDANDPRVIRPIEVGGHGMDAQWSDDFHHALHALLTGDQIGYYQDFGKCSQLAKAYQDSFVYDWQYSPHRQRFHGNVCRDRPSSQFVVCIQNHDQIGNRMLGERLSHLTSFEGLKLAAGALILSPFVPLLFMGEEYGEEAPFTYFVSHSDTGLIHAVREGRKREFAAFHAQGEPPDPESAETFEMCKLNWETRTEGQHHILWMWYQQLIQIRNTMPALKRQDHLETDKAARTHLKAGSDNEKKVVWWHRWSDNNHALCLMNFNPNDVVYSPDTFDFSWEKVLDSADKKWMGDGSRLPEKLEPRQELTLRSQSFALYKV
ncbi:malto-oligosyltrehalose trehalohydrolase [Myxacorys almedinensis A]|uniref:Malto-oligosyltrehalose trehalohydrolase n=1 Tax=Myxacorys almedinensis A TaxID=2690445 RepID=A0A8J8CLI8_9CYAN|nr:malto-oligosyltrehalose trehalohydrolase [Myxacorys almedinensis A]